MACEQLRETLNAEFHNDPAAFLRRFVRAYKAHPERRRPSTSSLRDMIDLIVEYEMPRQVDWKADIAVDFILFTPDFLVSGHPMNAGC